MSKLIQFVGANAAAAVKTLGVGDFTICFVPNFPAYYHIHEAWLEVAQDAATKHGCTLQVFDGEGEKSPLFVPERDNYDTLFTRFHTVLADINRHLSESDMRAVFNDVTALNMLGHDIVAAAIPLPATFVEEVNNAVKWGMRFEWS